MENLTKYISEAFARIDMDDKKRNTAIQTLSLMLESAFLNLPLQAKLNVLYVYEEKYLKLLREYREEIKFAANLQEDLRKERTKFFSGALKEVSETLKESQVDDKIASIWIEELVNSYTKSLDLSSGLIEEQTLDTIAEIRQNAKKEVKSVKINSE